jgi:hypothetical protein
MERKPYHQRVIEDVDPSMSLFQHIGVPAKTFNLHGERKAGPWALQPVAHGPVKVARVGLGFSGVGSPPSGGRPMRRAGRTPY